MAKHERESERYLPPCERAQADGVPCTELGRDCEICEKAFPRTRDPREKLPEAPGSDLPVSGA